jgi:nicotinate-nucleotide pyrophosphorylase (carboxylating)
MKKKQGIDFPKRIERLSDSMMKSVVRLAIIEDLDGRGDITTTSLFAGLNEISRTGRILAKESGIICGTYIAARVYSMVSSSISIDVEHHKKDGDYVEKGDTILVIKGKPSAITTGERIALNFLGLLSGVSTKVNRYVKLLDGSPTKLLDTRKTLPGLREMQKYAVATGGGYNHRVGLYDMILIKDNHIATLGSVKRAVELAKKAYPMVPIEIETSTMEQVAEAVETEADILMLDNMDNTRVREAMKIIDGAKHIEVSGNIDEKRLKELGDIGVDFVSMGELTHTVKNLNLTLLIE